jgi:hypothetical protein
MKIYTIEERCAKGGGVKYTVFNHLTGEVREGEVLTTLLRSLIRDAGGK